MDKTRIDKYCVSSSAIVKDAIKTLNVQKGKIVIVLNAENVVVGTITDGDIRRALLAGVTVDYPIQKGQFLGMRQWWGDTKIQLINGGFFKYYPKDCKYIFDKFMSNVEHWQSHYIEKGVTVGPVNGEQNFVEESVKEKLELITFSDKWCTRWCQDPRINRRLDSLYLKYFHEPLILSYKNNREFNDKVKMVHFTYSLNKPHESEMFKDLYT